MNKNIKLKYILLLFFCLLSFDLFSSKKIKEKKYQIIQKKINVATTFYKKGEYQKSLQNFKLALTLGGNAALLYYNMGGCYIHLNNHGRALSCYRRVTELAPHFHKGWLNYGKLTYSLKYPGDALIAFRKALHLKPNQLELLLLIGDCYKENDAEGEAFYYYEKARTLHPAHIHPYISLVNLYLSINDYTSAVKLLEDGASLIKNKTLLYQQMAELYRLTKNWSHAAVAFEQLLLCKKKNKRRVYSLLADCYLQLKQPFLAISVLKKALKHYPQYLKAYFTLANIYQTNNFLDETSKQLLKAAGQNYYKTRNRLYNLCITYYNQKMWSEANQLCRNILKLNQRDSLFLKIQQEILGKTKE